jgi:hypothetical protein
MILLSCDNQAKTEKNKKNSDKIISSEQESVINLREFDEDLNLFLSFYEGMNQTEFRNSVNNELKSGRLFYTDNKNSDNLYSSLLNSKSFSDSKTYNDQIDINFKFNSNLYYPINTTEKSYYAKFSAKFDNGTLSSISLLGPSFNISSNPNFEKEKRIKEGENYKKEIIKMYSDKYGKPKITKREIESENWDYSLMTDYEFDKNIYTFNKAEKTIIISIQCCADFETEIKYILSSEYNKRRNKILLDKTKETEKKNIDRKKTLEEI